MTSQAIDDGHHGINRGPSLGGGGLTQSRDAQLIGGSFDLGKSSKVREARHEFPRAPCEPGEVAIDHARRASWIGDGFPLQRPHGRYELRGDQHQLEAKGTRDFDETRYLRIDGCALNLREMALRDPHFGTEGALTQACSVPSRDEGGGDLVKLFRHG
jgi:hypothetical protein